MFHSATSNTAESVSTNIKIFLGLNIILTVLIITTNGIFLITLIRKTSLHTPPNILLGALSISDLMVGLVLVPLFIADFCKRFQQDYSFLLHVQRVVFELFLIGLSYQFLALITFERYLAICHPFKYIKHASNWLAIKTSGFLSLFFAFASAVSFTAAWKGNLMVLYIIATVLMIIGLIVILVCNWRILKVIRRHRRQITSRNEVQARNHNFLNRARERKRNDAIVTLVLVFFICYIPTLIRYQLVAFGLELTGDTTKFIIYTWIDFLLLLNSLANPVLYCFRLQAIRKAVTETLVELKNVLCIV